MLRRLHQDVMSRDIELDLHSPAPAASEIVKIPFHLRGEAVEHLPGAVFGCEFQIQGDAVGQTLHRQALTTEFRAGSDKA